MSDYRGTVIDRELRPFRTSC